MKIKSFECPKSIRNFEKKILGTSDPWSMSCLSHCPSKPVYYIVDCRISSVCVWKSLLINNDRQKVHVEWWFEVVLPLW